MLRYPEEASALTSARLDTLRSLALLREKNRGVASRGLRNLKIGVDALEGVLSLVEPGARPEPRDAVRSRWRAAAKKVRTTRAAFARLRVA